MWHAEQRKQLQIIFSYHHVFDTRHRVLAINPMRHDLYIPLHNTCSKIVAENLKDISARQLWGTWSTKGERHHTLANIIYGSIDKATAPTTKGTTGATLRLDSVGLPSRGYITDGSKLANLWQAWATKTTPDYLLVSGRFRYLRTGYQSCLCHDPRNTFRPEVH